MHTAIAIFELASWWWLVLIAAGVAAGLLGASLDSVSRLAKRWGWEYEDDDDGPVSLRGMGCADLPQLSILRRRCRMLLSGRYEGVETAIVNLRPRTEIGTGATLACFRLPGRSLPRFQFTSTSEGGRDSQLPSLDPGIVLKRFGLMDEGQEVRRIRLGENPAFAKFFEVWLYDSQGEQILRRVMSREVQDFFMLHRERDWHVDAAGEWIGVLHKEEMIVSASKLKVLLKEMRPMYDLFVMATA